MFPWLLPVFLSLALRITSIRKRPHSIYYYSLCFVLSHALFWEAILEPLEPINVQTDVQCRELSLAAGSSSLNLISTTELHFRHHGPIPADLLSGHEGWQLFHNHKLSLHWSNYTWPERSEEWITGHILTVLDRWLCRMSCREWKACNVLMEKERRLSFIWFLICHMIMSLMCISMSFLYSFYSDLCLRRMESEIQTERNEIPEAKVGLYTWKWKALLMH